MHMPYLIFKKFFVIIFIESERQKQQQKKKIQAFKFGIK